MPTFGSQAEIVAWLRDERLSTTQVDDFQNTNCNGIDTTTEEN